MPIDETNEDVDFLNFVGELNYKAAITKPEDHSPKDMKEIRNWVWGYQCKFGPFPNPHPPTEYNIARLLAIASASELKKMLVELMNEREATTGYYSWFWRMALEHVYSIGFVFDPSQIRKNLTLIEGGIADESKAS